MAHVAVVTGGSGLTGQHVIRELQKQSDLFKEIRVVDLKPFEKVVDYEEKVPMRVWRADCANRHMMDLILEGATVVFHCAGKVYSMDMFVNAEEKEYRYAHVKTTEAIIRSMKAMNVEYLIATCCAVNVWGDRSWYNVTEAESRAPPHDAYFLGGAYGKSKWDEERLVLEANREKLANGKLLKTLAIRPTLMYGEGDNFIIKHAIHCCDLHGSLVKFGRGTGNFQFTYAGNVGHMHALAFRKLLADPSEVAGEAFYCSELNEGVHYFDFIEPFINACGFKMSAYTVPYWLVFLLTLLSENLALLLYYVFAWRLDLGFPNMRMVRKTSHYTFTFNCDKAVRMLGYRPIYEPGAAKKATAAWWKANWKKHMGKC